MSLRDHETPRVATASPRSCRCLRNGGGRRPTTGGRRPTTGGRRRPELTAEPPALARAGGPPLSARAGGLLSVSQSLPFGLALGVSRRSYYLGAVLLAALLAAVDGLAITGLQAIERATGGWGIGMHFFQVPYILSGPWYLTWLTSSVGLGLVFIYGVWFGLVFRRWNLIGLAAFAAAQVTVLAAGALVVTWTNAWASVGHFFTALSAAGVVLAAGGFATMRRVTV
jgi:hypothetical protein